MTLEFSYVSGRVLFCNGLFFLLREWSSRLSCGDGGVGAEVRFGEPWRGGLDVNVVRWLAVVQFRSHGMAVWTFSQ